MDELLQFAFGFIAIAGAIGAWLSYDPIDRLVALALVPAGVTPFIVSRGLLDVATAVSVIAPLGTIFLLLGCRGAAG